MTTPQPRLLSDAAAPPAGPVTCLGQTFAGDAARRAHFSDLLRAKLQDPAFRAIEGFPAGSDEAILALSDPPYYTACPNPWLADFIAEWQAEGARGQGPGAREERSAPGTWNLEPGTYHREPFAADVSEGKNDPIYNAHSYHTKVPHKAIMRYILHYTAPGDVVFDGFCGTGMTGVAAQLCGDRRAVEALGYRVDDDGTIHRPTTGPDGRAGWQAFARLGARRAVLNDLSPAATFIAYNYNTPVDVAAFQHIAQKLLTQFEKDYGWMYLTRHTKTDEQGRINFVVWSDLYRCSECQGDIVFWDDATEQGSVSEEITCPSCGIIVTKLALERATTTVLDVTLNKPIQKAVRIPVLINYSLGSARYEKEPDEADLALLRRIEEEPIPGWYPTIAIDRDIDLWYERDYRSLGIFSVDHFFHKRGLITVAYFRRRIFDIPDARLHTALWFWFQSVMVSFSLLNRYLKNAFSQVNRVLSGTLYVGAMISDVSPWYALEGKRKRFNALQAISKITSITSTQSTAMLNIPSDSVDYVFIDPPFGSNIIYSDLSIVWESWLDLLTNTDQEAVVHRRKQKGALTLEDYRNLMTRCFAELERILKPGHWITVEFSNTKAAVWNSIQTALTEAGFIVANVSALDKQQGSFKAVTTPTAVKQDLVISAYKPNGGFSERFPAEAQTEAGVWDFVRTHLRYLPVAKEQGGALQGAPERDARLLYDQLVAYYVRHGYPVPLGSQEFQRGLAQRFSERDGFYFLPEQAVDYDRRRLLAGEVAQPALFVADEASAIAWLRQQLRAKPQLFADLNPLFLQQLGGWRKSETQLDLRDLLEENFLRYDGQGPVPEPVHAYLSSNYKDLRNLAKDDPALRARAKDRWYAPDPNRAADLERLRERHLLREFETYRESKQRKLKLFRLEAMRAGFKRAWQARDYATIVAVAKKIPDDVLHEDPKLLMWLNGATTRIEQAGG